MNISRVVLQLFCSHKAAVNHKRQTYKMPFTTFMLYISAAHILPLADVLSPDDRLPSDVIVSLIPQTGFALMVPSKPKPDVLSF